MMFSNQMAAAFVRLCVETPGGVVKSKALLAAAAFVRLCVETQRLPEPNTRVLSSRLRAAVC